MEPDTVSADTMGDILCDQKLSDETRIVCYWELGDEYTKYWAVRKEDGSLLRFCREDSGYNDGYSVSLFYGILRQDGFRLFAPRGAAYNACDYYVFDSEGVPRLLASCSGEVEESDLNGDGETDLHWYYHGGGMETFYFRKNGQLYQYEIDWVVYNTDREQS